MGADTSQDLKGSALQLAIKVLVSSCALLVTPAGAETDLEGLACLSPPFDGAETPQQEKIVSLLAWLDARLEAYVPLAQILDEEPPEFCLGERLSSALFGANGYYEVETHRIALQRSLPDGLMRAVAIHELRHVQQARLGICPGPDLSMQEAARVTLAMEADASAVSLAIAWDLKQSGEPEVWNALSEWHSQEKLADAFEVEMLNSGDVALATSAAFSEWYEIDWMREAYYVAACSAYLDHQDATKALPQYGSIEPEVLGTLCTLPTGVPYRCEALGRNSDIQR